MAENFSKTRKLPRVVIVLVNHNGKPSLINLLEELFNIDYANLEVVLVDNNSTDGSLEYVRGNFFKAVLIKNSENIGVSSGMNVGIKYALERSAEYILLLRQEASGLKNILPGLVDKMEQDKKVGLSSPIILENNSGSVFFSGKINWLKMRLENIRNASQGKYFNATYLLAGAMLIRAEVFRQVGLLNKDHSIFYGEEDFSFRAASAGYKLLVSSHSQIILEKENQKQKEGEKYWRLFSTLLFFKNNTPAYLRPWAVIFFTATFLKLWIERRFFRGASSSAAESAYIDFYRNESFF